MRFEIIIEDVDNAAMLDINYIIQKYLRKVDGIVDIGTGTVKSEPDGSIRNRYRIEKNSSF